MLHDRVTKMGGSQEPRQGTRDTKRASVRYSDNVEESVYSAGARSDLKSCPKVSSIGNGQVMTVWEFDGAYAVDDQTKIGCWRLEEAIDRSNEICGTANLAR